MKLNKAQRIAAWIFAVILFLIALGAGLYGMGTFFMAAFFGGVVLVLAALGKAE